MERKKGIILSNVMMIFEVLSTLLVTPLLIKSLGQAEYGVYKLSASIMAYLLLLDLGIGNAIIRYISKYRAKKDYDSERKFFGVAINFYLCIAIISVIGGFVLILLFPYMFSKGLTAEEIELGQNLLFITMLNVAVTMATTVYTNIIIAYERFTISKGVPIIQIIFRIVLTVVALSFGVGSVGIVVINLILTVICRGFFTLYVFFVLKLRPKFKNIDFDFVKNILIYSSWILVQMVATQINASMDQILLGSLVSASSTIIAVYSVGIQIVQYFKSIGSSFTGVLMPGVVRLVEKNASEKTICDEMIRIGRMIFMGLGLIWGGFLVFGQQFIDLWAGKENENAYYVAIILLTADLFILVEAVGTQILWAKNEHKEQALLKLAIVFVNIVLTIFLIRWNPLIGATIGTFISLILGDIVVMNIVFLKKLKISLKQYYRGLFKGILLTLFITIVMGWVISLIPLYGWIGLILKIICMCSIYFITLWAFGMNDYEKNVVKALLNFKKRTERKDK